jgi:hypothetical protein
MKAKPSDYKVETITVYEDSDHPSQVVVPIM